MNQAAFLTSNLGFVRIETSPKGIVSVGFAKRPAKDKPRKIQPRNLKKCASELGQYFRGSRTRFTVKLDLAGTPFQKKVWSELAKIPCGQVLSYSELAARIGHPRSARAVGSAAGANPVCILVPCHRLVGSKGWGGYAYGLVRKKKLLELEGRRIQGASAK